MFKRKINVAYFIGSLNIGGAENQVVMLVNSLNPEKFNRHVITLNDTHVGFRNALVKDVKYFSIQYRRRNAITSLISLYHYLKDNNIDVLHCHMYHAAVKGAVIGRIASVPLILVSEHGKNTWKKLWHRIIERKIVSRWTSMRIAVSEDIRQLRIEQDGIPGDTIIVMPNAVDTNVIQASNIDKPKKIGSLGRLVDAKDFYMLLKSVRLLIDRGYNILLEIAGEGPERESLEQAVKELRLENNVSMPGICDAHSFLSSIDIFVMSSKREGVPVSLLEAMAHGLPIVSTSVGGIPEVIKDGVEGLLSPSGQYEALSNNIGNVIDNKELRIKLGKNAREKVRLNYGIESVTRTWESLYMSGLQETTERVIQ